MARQKKQEDETQIFGLSADVIEQQITKTSLVGIAANISMKEDRAVYHFKTTIGTKG